MAKEKDSWDVGCLGDVVAEVIAACHQEGPQTLVADGTSVAVLISQRDWLAIRTLLKDGLVSAPATGYPKDGRPGDSPFTWVPRIVGNQAGEDGA